MITKWLFAEFFISQNYFENNSPRNDELPEKQPEINDELMQLKAGGEGFVMDLRWVDVGLKFM